VTLFGTYLKHHRTQKELSIRKLAETIGVDPSILSRLERGEITTPSEEILTNLPAALDRPKVEVYLAAQRITPELATRLERGFPLLLEQMSHMLMQAEEHLTGLTEMPSLPIEELLSPTDAETMQQILGSVNDLGEITQALLDGRTSQEQFGRVAEIVHQMKMIILDPE